MVRRDCVLAGAGGVQVRRVARVDANQAEIVQALRDIGATVQHMHQLGEGCPDILVGYRGHNLTFEIKDNNKPPSKRRLTSDEQIWHDNWRGQVAKIKTFEEAVSVIEGYLD